MNGEPQTALVTGASSGMGKKIAASFLNGGHKVYVAARSLERMADLEAKGAIAIAMDISDEDQIVAAMARIRGNGDRVGILVNNAGFGLYGSVEETAIAEARYQFEVNLFGLARLTQLVLPDMRASGHGMIINITSMGGRIYTPLGAWYHATKHALEGWSDCLRIEVAPFGIDVVIVEPGIITTGFGEAISDPLLKRSGDGPYAGMARAVARTTRAAYRPGSGSDPQAVADVVMQAVNARRPKTRYGVGKFAKPLLAMRRILSDRMFDRLILRQVK